MYTILLKYAKICYIKMIFNFDCEYLRKISDDKNKFKKKNLLWRLKNFLAAYSECSNHNFEFK